MRIYQNQRIFYIGVLFCCFEEGDWIMEFIPNVQNTVIAAKEEYFGHRKFFSFMIHPKTLFHNKE